MTTFVNRPATPARALTLEEMAAIPPEPATKEMPPEMRHLLRADSGVYIRSKEKPTIGLVTEEVTGAEGVWRVVGPPRGTAGELLTVIPGREQTKLDIDDLVPVIDGLGTEGYRPPWVAAEDVPALRPFRVDGHVVYGPRAIETPERLSFPFRSIGVVRNSKGQIGTGVLIGPNLLLTAGHLAPWGQKKWHMEFVPAFRAGGMPPFGTSFVERFRGYDTHGEASGHDYVICKLYRPLGEALGWMGTRSFGTKREYFRRRYTSSGYPGVFGDRPAVQFDMGLRDIANDGPGLELEFSLDGYPHIRGCWAGGPLWFDQANVVGVHSGNAGEVNGSRSIVEAGGSGMVDLVKFGLENWRP